MTYDGLAHQTLLAYPAIRDRLILLDGWSKTYAMTGWRMGYAVWPDALLDKMRKLAVNSYSCVNAPSQWAGLAALTGPQDAVAAMVAEFDRRRRVVVEGLNALAGRLGRDPEGRLLCLSEHLARRAGRQSRWPRRCSRRPASPPSAAPTSASTGKAILRLSYANSTDNIREALRRMAEFLGSRKPG